MKFTRITIDPLHMGGVPCIRGLRIPVATIVGMFADGIAEAEILKAYPDGPSIDTPRALPYNSPLMMTMKERARDLALAASEKPRMQGAQILRNEAYRLVRRSDEGCSEPPQTGFFRGRHV